MKMEKTTSRNHFPEKCSGCAKSSKPFIHDGCSFCQNLNFQEELLCDLNRSTQNPAFFKCHAFQPLLKVVAPSGQKTRREPKVHPSGFTLEKLLDSDKIKYRRALARQRLARNPDEIMLEIKYHFAWNVIGRKPVFSESAPVIGFINNTITTCSEAVGGFADLLWLAPDHIHLYVVSDGEVTPDKMAQDLKRHSETAILKQFPDLISSSEAKTGLWDEAYFVETIG